MNPLEEYIDNSVSDGAYVCLNGNMYYLMQVSSGVGDSIVCSSGEDIATSCLPNTFGILPGLDKLDGSGWGGVTRDDFVAG